MSYYWKELWSQNLLEKYNRLINRPPCNRQDLYEFMNDLKQIEEETYNMSNISRTTSTTWGVCQAYMDYISQIQTMTNDEYLSIRYTMNICSLGPDLWLDTIIMEIHSEFLDWLEDY